ncbi:MAG: hypothetical protein ACFFG0_35145 [Candidatus Thorarchaeota archaeon]
MKKLTRQCCICMKVWDYKKSKWVETKDKIIKDATHTFCPKCYKVRMSNFYKSDKLAKKLAKQYKKVGYIECIDCKRKLKPLTKKCKCGWKNPLRFFEHYIKKEK